MPNIFSPFVFDTAYYTSEKFQIRSAIEHIYLENKEKFDALIQEFLKLTEHGNILQIAIPKKHLNKHVYLTTSGGPKIKTVLQKNIINYSYDIEKGIQNSENHTIKTNNVIELIETLKNNPENIHNSDQQEFAWVVTDDTVQKAIEDGVQIKSFNTADPEKLQKVTTELENLLREKLAGHWAKTEPTPWECYKKYKNSF